MKKLIVTLSVILIAALLGIGGWFLFKSPGPRVRLQGEKGAKVLVEELSFYNRREKIFGKVFKPADENGNFPDSSEPARRDLSPCPARYRQSGSDPPSGGFQRRYRLQCYLPRPKSEISFYVKKLANEPFVDDELIFLISTESRTKQPPPSLPGHETGLPATLRSTPLFQQPPSGKSRRFWKKTER